MVTEGLVQVGNNSVPYSDYFRIAELILEPQQRALMSILIAQETLMTAIQDINAKLDGLSGDVATQLQQTRDALALLGAKVDELNLAEAQAADLRAQLDAVEATLDPIAARIDGLSADLRSDDPAPVEPAPEQPAPVEPQPEPTPDQVA